MKKTTEIFTIISVLLLLMAAAVYAHAEIQQENPSNNLVMDEMSKTNMEIVGLNSSKAMMGGMNLEEMDSMHEILILELDPEMKAMMDEMHKQHRQHHYSEGSAQEHSHEGKLEDHMMHGRMMDE